MTTVAITSEALCWTVYGADANWIAAYQTATQHYVAAVYLTVGQELDIIYYNNRAFLKFDTSVIPAGATINQVYLTLTLLQDATDIDADVYVRDCGWSAQDPIDAANRDAAYDAVLAAASDNLWRNTLGLSINTPYASSDLSTAWVNKGPGAYTYYALIWTRDGVTPPGEGVDEFITIRSAGDATPSYRPILTVVYTPNTDIGKVAGVLQADVGKVAGVAIASVGKVAGVGNA